MRRRTGKGLVWAAAVALSCAGMLAALAGGQGKPDPADLTAAKSLGSRQAPVTVEVFSDYQCPQCKRLYAETTRPLIDNYVNSGKVYFVHHDFPLPMHAYSHLAAHWMNAVAAVGNTQFYAAEQVVYAKQDDWGATGKVDLAIASALSPADMKKVRQIEATEGPQLDAAIDRDIALGNSKHVDATPSIYVTHHGETEALPPGGVGYPLFKQYLDYLLQR